MLINYLDKLKEVVQIEYCVLALRQTFDQELIRIRFLVLRVCILSTFDLKSIESEYIMVQVHCEGIGYTQGDSYRVNHSLSMQNCATGEFFEVELLVARMLIKDKQITALVKRTKNETFVKLSNQAKLMEIALAKHFWKLVIADKDVLSIIIGMTSLADHLRAFSLR